MITSANRFSTMNGKLIVPTAEGYGVDSIGRILMENEMNDMAIFNATLRSDMYEIQARTEGTLLESEIEALSENAVKDFFKKIIDKLKVFWSKLKAFFKNAYAMLTAYVVKNGKHFVAANKRAISNLKGSETLKGECWVPKTGTEDMLASMKSYTNSFKEVGFNDIRKVVNKDDSVSDMTKAILKSNGPTNWDGDSSFFEAVKEDIYEKKDEPTLAQAGGKSALVTLLENGSAAIKALKEAEKKAEKTIKKEIKELENIANKGKKIIEKDNKDGEYDKAVELVDKNIEFFRNASTASCNALSTYSRTMVKLCKFAMAQARINLAKAIATSNNDAHDKYKARYESTLFESMLLEAAEEIEELDNDSASDLTPDEQEMVDEIIDAVEEAIENHEEGDEINADECDK